MVDTPIKHTLHDMDLTTDGMWIPLGEFKEAEKAILGYFDDKFSKIFKGWSAESEFKVHKNYYVYVGEGKTAVIYTQVEDNREWDREKRRDIPMGHIEVRLASDVGSISDLAKTVLDIHSCLTISNPHGSYMLMNPKLDDL